MITVEMVREKGFEFVAQDVINVSYPENEPDYQVIENRYLVDVNEKNPPWHDCDVKKFAWRDNKGEMPCDGDLLVNVELRRGDVITEIASELYWLVDTMRGDDITKWRPSFKNWEIQMNLDKIETQEEKEVFEGMANSSEIPNGSEWENGDECVIRGEKLIYIGESIEADIHCVQELGTCLYRNAHISVIEKPETPEQKAERERMEEINEISNFIVSLPTSVKILPNSLAERLHDAGYRKKNG